ncbi:MAG: hypothetical protein JRJ68_03565 [Deltaproteobacteria bacterium]|nr:hypothetical protein [Deltaproteobacteria bacterium]
MRMLVSFSSLLKKEFWQILIFLPASPSGGGYLITIGREYKLDSSLIINYYY